MYKRGPRPTPTRTLKIRASWRGKEREKAGEIDPPEGIPACPDWIPADVRGWWAELTDQLAGVHLLTKQDRLTLALLVDAIHNYLKCRKNPKNQSSLGKAWERVMRGAREFGLSPASRVGLNAAPKEKFAKDGKARFFKTS